MKLLIVYPPLPDSDSEEKEAPVTGKAGLVPGSVCSKVGTKSKLAAPWTLPPCQVTVVARHPLRFWENVRQKAIEMGDWALLDKIDPLKLSGMQSVAGEVVSGGHMTFPVFKAIPGSGQNDSHQAFAWKFVQDLQTKVAKFGINSSEVMQVVCVLNADVLAPYDIMHLLYNYVPTSPI